MTGCCGISQKKRIINLLHSRDHGLSVTASVAISHLASRTKPANPNHVLLAPLAFASAPEISSGRVRRENRKEHQVGGFLDYDVINA